MPSGAYVLLNSGLWGGLTEKWVGLEEEFNSSQVFQ